ncbi:MAG: type II toxin-antitoxin system HicB family antitoxin [Cyanobacteria bacterium J06614_10]
MKYLVVIEKTQTGFSAYSPDFSGCVTTGTTQEETAKNMEEAILLRRGCANAFHKDYSEKANPFQTRLAPLPM